MMDIVERLRFYVIGDSDINAAADEIERLRAAEAEVERLRKALKEVSGYVARADWFNMTEETKAVVDKIFGEKE
jgi:Ni,Fe-hydrogenase III large subunit